MYICIDMLSAITTFLQYLKIDRIAAVFGITITYSIKSGISNKVRLDRKDFKNMQHAIPI